MVAHCESRLEESLVFRLASNTVQVRESRLGFLSETFLVHFLLRRLSLQSWECPKSEIGSDIVEGPESASKPFFSEKFFSVPDRRSRLV